MKHLRGIGITHLHALGFLAENHRATMTEIARHLQITPSSATSFVTRLEKRGYVKRSRDAGNRKLVRLSLTAKGKTLLSTLKKGHRHLVAEMFGGLPANVQKSFAESLAQVVAHVSKT